MNYQKLSANMAALVEEFQSPSGPALMNAALAVPLNESANDFESEATPTVFALIRCDWGAVIDPLPGADIHNERGRVRTALVTLEGIDLLSEHPDVRYISAAVTLNPLNDVAAQRTGLPAFKSRVGAAGRGVVVGVVDSGIDADHPAFAGRIHSIWDQTMSGAGWGTNNFGTVLTAPNLGGSLDTNGHGTHVAGIAAGNDARFGGVAPEADIVVVKTNFLNAGIIAGIRYVFHVAEQLGKPAVVNLSLGGHHDAHDGSDNLATAIDDDSGPGRIVVAAAGNEAGDHIHGVAVVPPGQTVDIPVLVPPNSQPGKTPFVRLNGWYSQGGACDLSVVTSSGDRTPFHAADASPEAFNFSNASVRITTPPTGTNPNGDRNFLVELNPGPFSNSVQGGTWFLRVRNNQGSEVRIDVWSIVPQGARDAEFAPGFDSQDMKIGSPGCAGRVVTVGSFTTRNKWQDSGGASRAVGLTLDTISDFSSPGPLRNGRRKPDVTAPGAMIISCQSKDSSPRASDIVGGGFRVNAGTSMACPFITGLVALLLQDDPSLDSAAVKARLRGHSSVPGEATGSFNNQWGFGLIDVGSL
jgi:subtilisin family serine protease